MTRSDVGTGVHIVIITAPDPTMAEKLVRAVVEEGLAACGSIVPGVTSIYRWQGEIETATESIIILKTSDATLESLITRVPELHPYDVPELLALPVTAGHAPYLDWVRSHGGV